MVARGALRIRRVRWTVAAALAGRGAAIMVTLITIPLTVNYLGPARYGYWVAIVSATSLLTFADLGLGYGLLNRAAVALGVGETIGARRLVSNAFWMLLGLAAIGSAVLLVAFRILPWIHWFPGADAAAAAECGRAVAVIGGAILLGLPFMTWQRTIGAAQLGFWSHGWDALGGVVSLGCLLAVILREGSLIALAAAYAAGPLVSAVGGWVWFFGFRRKDLRPQRADWDASVARGMLSEGVCYFVMQLGGLALTAVSALILLYRCGPDEVTSYFLVAKLFQIGPQLAGMWFAPLWPAYCEALARHDAEWAHRTLRTVTLGLLGVGLAASAVLGPAAAELVRLWTGVHVFPSLSLLLGLSAIMVLGVTTTSVSTFLNASRYLNGQAWLVAVQVPASLLLAWVLAGWWGSAGVAWGVALGYTVIAVPVYAVVVPLTLARQRLEAAGSAVPEHSTLARTP